MAAAPGGSQLWAAWRAASATEKLCALVLVLACVHLRDWLARQPSQDAKPAAALQVVHALCRTRWRSPTLLLLAACGVLLLSVPADIAALLVAVALAVMPGLLDGVARRASKFADVLTDRLLHQREHQQQPASACNDHATAQAAPPVPDSLHATHSIAGSSGDGSGCDGSSGGSGGARRCSQGDSVASHGESADSRTAAQLQPVLQQHRPRPPPAVAAASPMRAPGGMPGQRPLPPVWLRASPPSSARRATRSATPDVLRMHQSPATPPPLVQYRDLLQDMQQGHQQTPCLQPGVGGGSRCSSASGTPGRQGFSPSRVDVPRIDVAAMYVRDAATGTWRPFTSTLPASVVDTLRRSPLFSPADSPMATAARASTPPAVCANATEGCGALAEGGSSSASTACSTTSSVYEASAALAMAHACASPHSSIEVDSGGLQDAVACACTMASQDVVLPTCEHQDSSEGQPTECNADPVPARHEDCAGQHSAAAGDAGVSPQHAVLVRHLGSGQLLAAGVAAAALSGDAVHVCRQGSSESQLSLVHSSSVPQQDAVQPSRHSSSSSSEQQAAATDAEEHEPLLPPPLPVDSGWRLVWQQQQPPEAALLFTPAVERSPPAPESPWAAHALAAAVDAASSGSPAGASGSHSRVSSHNVNSAGADSAAAATARAASRWPSAQPRAGPAPGVLGGSSGSSSSSSNSGDEDDTASAQQQAPDGEAVEAGGCGTEGTARQVSTVPQHQLAGAVEGPWAAAAEQRRQAGADAAVWHSAPEAAAKAGGVLLEGPTWALKVDVAAACPKPGGAAAAAAAAAAASPPLSARSSAHSPGSATALAAVRWLLRNSSDGDDDGGGSSGGVPAAAGHGSDGAAAMAMLQQQQHGEQQQGEQQQGQQQQHHQKQQQCERQQVAMAAAAAASFAVDGHYMCPDNEPSGAFEWDAGAEDSDAALEGLCGGGGCAEDDDDEAGYW